MDDFPVVSQRSVTMQGEFDRGASQALWQAYAFLLAVEAREALTQDVESSVQAPPFDVSDCKEAQI